jgi:hypothetical protein
MAPPRSQQEYHIGYLLAMRFVMSSLSIFIPTSAMNAHGGSQLLKTKELSL